MISRIWHGYTTFENAETYKSLLRSEIFIGIQGRSIPGFQEIQLFRRELEGEVEFITVMWFNSIEFGAHLRGARLRGSGCPAQGARCAETLR